MIHDNRKLVAYKSLIHDNRMFVKQEIYYTEYMIQK